MARRIEIDGRYVETETRSRHLMIVAKIVFGGVSGDAATRAC
jgi:hypothetical protein